MPRDPLTIIEIDIDRCTLNWGVGACTAALAANSPRKCFKTFGTCKAKGAFSSAPFTIRLCEPRGNLPPGLGLIPVVEDISQITATVNIAGTDESLGPLGRTATVTVTCTDPPHDGLGIDPYWAERISGAAQFDGIGYPPGDFGTLWGKLKAWWPHFAGRAMRVVEGWIEDGAFVEEASRAYILSEWTGPSDKGRIQLKAKDPLSQLNDDKLVEPPVSRGVLAADISAVAATATLAPAGIGDTDYPAAGRICFGSEMADYTRTGDVLTLTARGVRGTKAATHSTGDTAQQVLVIDGWRIDDLVEYLASRKLPAEYLPKVTKWAPEVSRWAPSIKLTTDIAKPEGVAKLLGELAVLGVSIFWDDVAWEMGFKINRPIDNDLVYPLSDFGELLTTSVEERDDKRLTNIFFYTVQLDPTRSATSSDNFARLTDISDGEALDPRAFGDARIRRIFCRWLNNGADAVVRVLGRRLLRRLNTAPKRLTAEVAPKDRQIPLAAVCPVQTDVMQDDIGRPLAQNMQLISRAPTGHGGKVQLVLQAYQFAGRYAYATENTRPDYVASSEAQRARGMYAADPFTLKMSNGDEPFLAI